MKVSNKEILVKEKHVETLLKEKKILEACSFPFIFKLSHCIQDRSNVMMLYQLKPTDDYFRWEWRTFAGILCEIWFFRCFSRNEKYSEAIVRFYSSQIILALEYLHHLGIIYRDLRPENVLVDNQGYIRLRCNQKLSQINDCKSLNFSCFKQSKIVSDGRTNSFCYETDPEYLAPEMILDKTYDQSIDW